MAGETEDMEGAVAIFRFSKDLEGYVVEERDVVGHVDVEDVVLGGVVKKTSDFDSVGAANGLNVENMAGGVGGKDVLFEVLGEEVFPVLGSRRSRFGGESVRTSNSRVTGIFLGGGGQHDGINGEDGGGERVLDYFKTGFKL